MDNIFSDRARSLFDQIIGMSPPDQEELLESLKGDDYSLQLQLRELLSSVDEAPDFIEQLNQRIFKEPIALPTATLKTDDTVNEYTVLRALGSGGMSNVYLARRNDGVHTSNVALKMIREPNGADAMVDRFLSERNILASLKHPNIAQLLDGGATKAGLPYLVMDYVEGEHIDVYCRNQTLSLTQILQLFVKVCDAVSLAHQKLILHRDIKPSNVLVDVNGNPKLLDFGIAKLLSTDHQDLNLTQTSVPMTPKYASPADLVAGRMQRDGIFLNSSEDPE